VRNVLHRPLFGVVRHRSLIEAKWRFDLLQINTSEVDALFKITVIWGSIRSSSSSI
jgi:hypothetical protein